MRQAITPPTLEEMRRSVPWLWVHCANSQCRHTVPMALTSLIIRWGADASSDVLRQSARCTKCWHKGATLQLFLWRELVLSAQKHKHLIDHVRTKVRGHVVDVLRGADGSNVHRHNVEVRERSD
jgi:hypothetical protein